MPWSDILALMGLVLGTVGGIALAYDVFFKSGAKFQESVAYKRLQTHRQFRANQQATIKATNASPAEIQKDLDKEEADNAPNEQRLEKDALESIDKYEERVRKIGGWGVLLIVIGFGCQIAGIICHAIEEQRRDTNSHNQRGRGQEQPHVTDLRFSRPQCVQPFPSGEDRATDAENRLKILADRMRSEMSHNRLMSVVFVGSVDKEPLSPAERKKFKTNLGLAEARAKWVEERLRLFLPALPAKVVALASGPRVEARTREEKELDRFVAIYFVWEHETSKMVEELTEPGFTCDAQRQ
jgi:hypothetical protein